MAAQLEDGYTRIANEILEHVSKSKFNGTQLSILLFVWRFTYGFQRKSCEMSLSFIGEGISADKHQVKRELKKLIDYNVITVHSPPDFNATREIGFNKDFRSWKTNDSGLISTQGTKKTTVNKKAHATVDELAHPPVGELAHQERKVFKENIKENQEEEITAMDAYRFSFKKLMYTGHIEGYVKELLGRGIQDSFIREVFMEMGERGIGADVNYMKKLAEDWIVKGISTREESKRLRDQSFSGISDMGKKSGKQSWDEFNDILEKAVGQ